MLVGRKRWKLVSIDTAGVPQGGAYGKVRWFSENAKKHGLYIGWSRAVRWFVVFSKRGSGFVSQLPCFNHAKHIPIKLTRKLLYALAYAQNQFGRHTAHTFQAAIEDGRRAEAYEREQKKLKIMNDKNLMNHVMDGYGLNRKVFACPTKVYNG